MEWEKFNTSRYTRNNKEWRKFPTYSKSIDACYYSFYISKDRIDTQSKQHEKEQYRHCVRSCAKWLHSHGCYHEGATNMCEYSVPHNNIVSTICEFVHLGIAHISSHNMSTHRPCPLKVGEKVERWRVSNIMNYLDLHTEKFTHALSVISWIGSPVWCDTFAREERDEWNINIDTRCEHLEL